MNLKALLTAALFAALAVASLVLYTKRLELEVSGGERVSILMIAKPVKKNAILSEDALSVRQIPIAYIDDRMVRASDKPKVVGVRVEHDLDPQQLLGWVDVAVSGLEDRHLSQLVQPGTRALTLHIPQQYMSAALLRPGDYVDVLGILAEAKTPQSVVLLQRVLVLAVGHDTTPSHEGGRDMAHPDTEQLVTIAVTLQESQTISLAATKGPVIAVLRSAEDQSISENTPPVTQLPTQKENVTVRPILAKIAKPTNLGRPE
ncbi:MAG: Flp pilus assembly protein RcpC/CpaB [Labilithrix sp.]|nr:Flp pilus assembly protein RcpC/CpaB [Labilithrix sp.]